jgi:hypothetical protein
MKVVRSQSISAQSWHGWILKSKEDQLVEVSRVKREAFSAARAVRDALGNIPDRVSNQMAAESDPVIIHQTLTEEIRKALETLTDA